MFNAIESFNQRHSLPISIDDLINSSYGEGIVLSLTQKGSGTYLNTHWMRLDNGVLVGDEGVISDVVSIKSELEKFYINGIESV